jgi:hypothetical protein
LATAAAAGGAGLAAALLLPLAAPGAVVGLAVAGAKVATLLAATKESIGRAGASGVPVVLAKAEDLHLLEFPPGHPRSKVLYVAHPFDRGYYVPMASFHRVLFEHKAAEAIRLLSALGARSIEVQQVTGTEDSASLLASFGVPVHGIRTDIGGGVGRSRATHSSVSVLITQTPSRPAHVPAGLTWYPHEALWRNMAHLRLDSGLGSYSLSVDHKDDFGVNARASVKAHGFGFDLGGQYADFSSTHWTMRATFVPLDELPPRGSRRT